MLTMSHSDPTALTASEYDISVICVDDTKEVAAVEVKVVVLGRGPSFAEIVAVDVSSQYLPLTVLHMLSVTDPDGDPLTCTQTSSSADFTVDTNDCTIRNAPDLRSLPLTSSEVIEINVTDGNSAPVIYQRTLSFTNQNQPPVFSPPVPAEVSVPEDVTSADTLVTFDVTDDQPFSRTFSVDTGASLFDFDSSTGEVKLASGQSFDYELGTRTFIIKCVAVDSFFQSTSSVTLAIVDANDAPTLSPLFVDVIVPEGLPSSMVATLPFTITDEDADDDPTDPNNHKFSVVPGGSYSHYFGFSDPHQSILTNLIELDREGGATSFAIEVAATDGHGKSATAQVTVTIIDKNDNDPVFDASSLVMDSVYVGMAAGSVLGKVKATDADEGTNQDLVFSLDTASPDPALFGVQGDGKVSLLKELTEAYGSMLSLTVKATDQGSSPRSATAVVTLDWNKPPLFTNMPNNAKVPEDPSDEKLLFTLSTSDPESDVVTSTVTDVSPSLTGAFVVRTIPGTSAQGVYYTGDEDLSRDVTVSYDVTVTAADGKGGTSSAVLTVEVTANTPPTSSCDGFDSATVDVATAAINEEVMTLTVSDVENDYISFTMTPTPDSGSFVFDSGLRRVEVARDLRLEAQMLHELQITISDNHNPALTCTLVVTLINMYSPPVFTAHQSLVPVEEHVTPLTTLFQFEVTDDAGPFTVRWEVDPVSESKYFLFDDATKEVKLASGESFDYETKPTEFVIKCIAGNSYLQSTSSVTISIFNDNDPPYFLTSPVVVSVTEGEPAQVTFLPSYNEVDPENDALTYSIVAGGMYSDYFTINSADGTLTNQKMLDQDEGAPNPISIEVMVTDNSGESATTEVRIHLTDINDNTPVIAESKYEFRLGLGTTKGTLLGTLSVSDRDDGDNGLVDFSIISQTPINYMTLEPDGRLYLTRDLDVDYGTLFSLNVLAVDRGTPPLNATVVVDVVWNEGPKIHNLPETVYVEEDIAVQKAVFDLSVTDYESDQYTCIMENIDPNTKAFDVVDTANKNFKVFYTGSGSLSSSAVTKYFLTVHCEDEHGEVSKVLTISVNSNIAPMLDCAPSDTITVDASITGQDGFVHTIVATDKENDPLEYEITSSAFYVGTYTGTIKARQSLRAATTEKFSVSVSVSDPKHRSDCTLFVKLDNVNVAPFFANLDKTVKIPENTAAGSTLYEITVTDPNIFEASNIGIELISSSSDKFKFDLDVSGLKVTVRLAAGYELDYEDSNERTMTLTFEASDGYLTSDEGTLTIQVTPVNEPPYFDKNVRTYYATFFERSSPPEVKALGCQVIDPDENDEVTLTLSGPDADLFTIADLDNCQLTLTSEYDLDKVLSEVLTLTLTATDKQGEAARATVNVTIQRVNDHDPEFGDPVLLTVGFGMQAGNVIGNVSAIDDDIGTDGILSYSVYISPTSQDVADDYLTFTSNGQFRLRKSMDAFETSENLQYVIQALDQGDPPRSATTTVNVVYDPFYTTTTTPVYNTTTTLTTTVVEEEDETSLLEEPLVIGLLVALACILAILAALAVCLCCKYCECCDKNSRPVSANSDYPSRNNSSILSTNKISAEGSGFTSVTPLAATAYGGSLAPPGSTSYEGRKISAINGPPPPPLDGRKVSGMLGPPQLGQ